MNQDEKIEAFLSGDMTTKARHDFEKEMAQNSSLRQEVDRYRKLNAALAEIGKDGLRKQLSGIQKQHGPLADPDIDFLTRLKFWFWAKRSPLLFGGVLMFLFIAAFGIFLTAQCPQVQLAEEYYFRPVLIHDIAGENELTSAKRASFFYATQQRDSLNILTTTSKSVFIDYYHTHLLQEEGQYETAQAGYEKLLLQTEELTKYSAFQDVGRLKFNLILCEWANRQNVTKSQENLNQLEADPSFQGRELQDALQGFREKLRLPLFPSLCL